MIAIAVELNRIANYLESDDGIDEGDEDDETDIDEPTPVSINDSIGTCPECNSSLVEQQGELPKALFRCLTCNVVWINSLHEYFSS